jgi:hypothetical protein
VATGLVLDCKEEADAALSFGVTAVHDTGEAKLLGREPKAELLADLTHQPVGGVLAVFELAGRHVPHAQQAAS